MYFLAVLLFCQICLSYSQMSYNTLNESTLDELLVLMNKAADRIAPMPLPDIPVLDGTASNVTFVDVTATRSPHSSTLLLDSFNKYTLEMYLDYSVKTSPGRFRVGDYQTDFKLTDIRLHHNARFVVLHRFSSSLPCELITDLSISNSPLLFTVITPTFSAPIQLSMTNGETTLSTFTTYFNSFLQKVGRDVSFKKFLCEASLI